MSKFPTLMFCHGWILHLQYCTVHTVHTVRYSVVVCIQYTPLPNQVYSYYVYCSKVHKLSYIQVWYILSLQWWTPQYSEVQHLRYVISSA